MPTTPENESTATLKQHFIQGVLAKQEFIYITGMRIVGDNKKAMFLASGITCEPGMHLFNARARRSVETMCEALKKSGISSDRVSSFIQVGEGVDKNSSGCKLYKVNIKILDEPNNLDIAKALLIYLGEVRSPLSTPDERQQAIKLQMQMEREKNAPTGSAREEQASMRGSEPKPATVSSTRVRDSRKEEENLGASARSTVSENSDVVLSDGDVEAGIGRLKELNKKQVSEQGGNSGMTMPLSPKA